MNDKSQRRASFLIRFGYLGHLFHGLQPNPGVATAGGALYDILFSAAGTHPKALQFSARTDAGVHALENYATCWFPRPFDEAAFMAALKTKPQTLLYVEAHPVAFNVHARASSRSKWYRYVIEDESFGDSHFAWRVAPALDVSRMQEAASHLVGTHAFDAFRHGGCSQGSTTKTLTRVEVTRAQSQIHVDLEGTAFLRRMVRIIIGTLAQIGAGLRAPHEMSEVLHSLRRENAGPSAPASGLTLMKVEFDLADTHKLS